LTRKGQDERYDLNHDLPTSTTAKLKGFTVSACVVQEYVPVIPGLTECCNTHDYCYDICGTDKSACDKDFQKCVKKLCSRIDLELSEEQRANLCEGWLVFALCYHEHANFILWLLTKLLNSQVVFWLLDNYGLCNINISTLS